MKNLTYEEIKYKGKKQDTVALIIFAVIVGLVVFGLINGALWVLNQALRFIINYWWIVIIGILGIIILKKVVFSKRK